MLNSAARAPWRRLWWIMATQLVVGVAACGDGDATNSGGTTSTTGIGGAGGSGGTANTGGEGGTSNTGGAGGVENTGGAGGAGAGGSGGAGAGGSGGSGGAGAGGSGGAGGAGGGGGPPPGPCDLNADGCGSASEGCIACSYGGECTAQLNTCAADIDCILFAQCTDPCPDQTCIDDCTTLHPQGATLFGALADCVVCSACYYDCANAGVPDPYPGCP